MTLTLSSKYAPLQRLDTRYAIVTGGRGSGKSFAIATMLIAKTEAYIGKTILFTRYTLTNAETSIMPEFMDKIERGNMQGRFHKSGNEITNLRTGTKILFRGIKTSTGINTAALKSIPNLVLWVNDESEELVDETTFDTIDLSIRDQNEHCEVWLVLNPADISHFIYRKFFAANGVEGGYNGVKGDVTYIHTTYEDNAAHLPADYIEKAERLRETDPKKYAHIWLGEWEANREGLVFPNWEEITEEEWPTGLQQWYGLDWGYSDPTAIVRECYDAVRGILYIREIACAYESIPSEVAPVIIEDARNIGYAPGECLIFCDSATPAGIAELSRVFGLNAQEADKRDKDYQISWLRGLSVRYIGENIRREVKSYSFIPSKFDRSVYTSTPQDGNDHFMDSARYGAFTYLQNFQGGGFSLGFGSQYSILG